MYRQGQEVLGRGLGRGASIVLGTLAALIGGGMVLLADASPSPRGFHLFALFCGAIAVTCFATGKVRTWVGRLLGASVFAVSVGYFVGQLMHGPVISGGRSQPSLLNAAVFLFVAGIPGLIFAIFGRFAKRRPEEDGQ